MVSFENVTFSYGENKVINNLSFSVSDGKSLLITGASGCGKTTVARLITRLIAPDSGIVTAPDRISVVFQEDRLIEKLNVYRNICLPLEKSQIPYAESLISEFGFQEIKNTAIRTLSGGMKRRVAIIRALAFCGDCLILDEPFNGIDKENAGKISEIITREYTNKGKSVIIISHNVSDAAALNAEVLKL